MRNVSNAFKRALYENKRNYACTATITLTDNTVLTVTNAEIWQNGLSTNENVSDESTFGALGSVVVNSATLIINNINEVYSQYDFTGAVVSINVGLLIGTSVESVKMGTFTVDDAQYNGALITLNCLDNMAKFDKPYSESTLVYPATLGTIVSNACTNCGVTLATPSFPNYNFQIDTRPTDTAITYREVISYAAVIAGCFAKCNNNGALELKWFDTDALQTEESGVDGGIFDITTADVYQSGDNVNGGTFNPWDTGDVVDGGSFTDANVVHHITALSSQDFSVDPVIITGIQLTVDSTVNAELTTVDHLYGTEGYLIKVEKNPFITETNVDAIGNYLSTNLVGLTFRKANITHLNDPSIEAGDVAIVIDRKEKVYPILITNTTFNVSSYQTTICAADTPVRNSATRYSAITKSQVEAQTLVKQEKTLRETMGANLTQAINAKSGMYETRVQETGGGYTYYMHDKPNLNESTAVIKITNEAVGITPNYQATPITWYGLTVDGNFIANIMSVIGIDFDWGTGGSLILGGNGNGNGTLTINDANDQPIGYWNNSGITANKGTIGAWTIGSSGIYNGKPTLDSTANGAYVGIDGIKLEDADSSKEIATSGGIYLKEKTNGGLSTFLNMESYDGFDGTFTPSFVDVRNTTTNDYVSISCGTNWAFGVRIDLRDTNYNWGIGIGDINGCIAFNHPADAPLITNYYNNTVYNILRNHNNGNISISASSGSLYLGYENTTGIDFLNGKLSIDSNGNLTTRGTTIWFANSIATASMIRFLPASDAYGHGISIGGGGATIIGGGESATTCQSLLSTYGDERMIIANDGIIEFYDNCQNGTSSAYKTSIESGSLYVGSNAGTDTVMHQVVARNAVANAAVHAAASGNHGLYSGTKSGWIIYCVSNSSDSTAYIPRNLDVSGSVFSTVSSGEARVTARNSGSGNRIYLYANSSNGGAGIHSLDSTNTERPILQRANNSNNITAYGAWTFNTGIKGNNNYTGNPVLTETSGASRISYMASATGYVLKVNAVWGGSTFATASATFTSSDVRLKEHIKDSTVKALPLINSIHMRAFDWKQDERHQDIGFIADELEKLDKNLAVGGGTNEDGTMNVKSVDTFYLLGYAIKAIQELSAEINRLKKKLGE